MEAVDEEHRASLIYVLSKSDNQIGVSLCPGFWAGLVYKLRVSSILKVNMKQQSLTMSYSLLLKHLVVADLLERGKRLGIEDDSRVLTTRSSTKAEYDCVVKRLRDARGTIRLLAATAVREATRNSPQAREDLWRAGAIPPLVTLLQEEDMGICYMATVALLNLAIGSVRSVSIFIAFPNLIVAHQS